MKQQIGKTALWLSIILPFAAGDLIAMAYRSINAILAHPLGQDLHLNNAEIGWITSVYLLSFAFVQLPLGMLLDSWGPRKSQTVLFAVGAAGIVIFSLAADVAQLALGRAILGIGMAGGLMAAFKAVADWVGEDEIPFYNSVILGIGGLGALLVTTPSKLFELAFGWRALCFAMAALTLAVAAMILTVTRDEAKPTARRASVSSEISSLMDIYKDRFFWQVAPLFVVSLGGFVAMRGLWLGPWLEHVVGLSPLTSAHYLMAISLAMTLGLGAGGLFAGLARRLRVPLALVVVLGIAVFIAIEAVVVVDLVSENYAVWVAYGFFGQVAVVNYALIAQHFGPGLSGRATTGVNIFIFLFAFAMQYAFGLVLHLWPGGDGTSQPIAGYKAAFSGLIVLQVLALAWFAFMARRSSVEDGASA